MSKVINGCELADKMQSQLANEVTELKKAGIIPKLVVILIGDDSASHIYVRNKEMSAQKIGISSVVDRLPETVSEKALLDKIDRYNQDESVHGILVQLPLPKQIDENLVLERIDPQKDVDGFHPINIGKLYMGSPDKIPCTPYGIMEMLKAYQIDPAGKRAVVVGRSNIVGKPMAQLLLMADATVTIAHSKTPDLAAVTRKADILVVAIGQGHLIEEKHVKPGAVVIDVGMNRNQSGKLIGDVAFDQVEPIASYITPVPKGVGPMTITMLMEQTVANARKQEAGKSI